MQKKLQILIVLMLLSLTSWAANKNANEVVIPTSKGQLHIIPLKDNAVRVKVTTGASSELEELIYTQKVKTPKFKSVNNGGAYTVSLKKIRVLYDTQKDQLSFYNNKGKLILQEVAGSRSIKKADVQNMTLSDVSQSFVSPSDEFLFGTGQFQDGNLNVRGLTRRLTQVNTQIAVPFIMSNKGYGLLWNNYGLTEFNPSTDKTVMSPTDEQGNVIEVDATSTEGNKRERRVSDSYASTITLDKDGEYSFLLDVGQTMARRLTLIIDGKPLFDYNNVWLPPTCSGNIKLSKGQHTLKVQGIRGDKPSVSWRLCNDQTVWHSPIAQGVDYTVFAGSADEVVASYRNLTGEAPLMPDYMLGYVHCRERYNTQDELVENVRTFREKNIPISVIVQDWQYWGKYGWNAMQFDEGRYPDPAKMVRDLHDMNVKLMLSVWSKVDVNSSLGKELTKRGAYIEGTDWIDFFKPEVTEYYWSQFRDRLLKPYDIDIWWFDATEPENDDMHNHFVGKDRIPGDVYRNIYPLKVINTMYNGLVKDDAGRTPCILTRSAFSGMQRYNAVVWSGDVGNDMNCLERQIMGGLNYVVTGMPWWTYDAGGFFRPGGSQYTDKTYQNRMLRWIQTSVFLPIMRVHGYQSNTEPWRYDAETERIFTQCINEREQMLPYLQKCAQKINKEGYTLMRPLIFDFADDQEALRQSTEYMFGPQYLVCPVTKDNATEWKVYLPKNTKGWVDHYTGKQYAGGQYLTLPVSNEHIIVFDRK